MSSYFASSWKITTCKGIFPAAASPLAAPLPPRPRPSLAQELVFAHTEGQAALPPTPRLHDGCGSAPNPPSLRGESGARRGLRPLPGQPRRGVCRGHTHTQRPVPPAAERPRTPPNRRPSRTLISRSRSEQSSGRAARMLNEAIFDGASPCGPLG